MSAIEIPEGRCSAWTTCRTGCSRLGGAAPRVGVRVADSVIDLAAALRDEVFAAPALNPFMAAGPGPLGGGAGRGSPS